MKDRLGSVINVLGANVRPDAVLAVDLCGALDIPGHEKERPDRPDNGVGVFPNPRFRDFLIELAERKKIKHFLGSIRRGGTDAGRIQINGMGVLAIYIGIPTRYGHSRSSAAHHDDFDGAVKLMVEACKALDAETVDCFRAF